MNHFKKLAIGVAAAAAVVAFAPQAYAQSSAMNFDSVFSKIATHEACDANKDGKVDKAEFLATMGQMWDARTKKMGVPSNAGLNRAQFDEIQQYMRAGG